MKAAAIVLAAVFVAGSASPAQAQWDKFKGLADKAADAKKKLDDFKVSDAEEKQIGEDVSLQLRERFGVMQDEKVTRYVTLVGTVLAQASTKPKMDWKFIVLDTDGVNAYATPGGFVHITRGLLGLMKNESELAGVLGHEITHITERHSITAVQQNKAVTMSGDAAGRSGVAIAKIGAETFTSVFEGTFSQADENQSDRIGSQLANKVGYAPNGMAEVLKKIQARNGSRQDRNGMFSSHPAIKERLSNNEKLIKAEKLSATATVAARYQQNITFDARPVTEIAMDVEGAAGLAAGDKKKAVDKKAEEAKKPEASTPGFGLSTITGGKQQASSQQASSAGARGGVPDRDAKGGPNKNPVNVRVTAAEIDVFKKGIGA